MTGTGMDFDHIAELLNPPQNGLHDAADSACVPLVPIDTLTAHIALLDERGVIVAVNAAWRCFADENGLQSPDYGVGTNYLDVSMNAFDDISAIEVAGGLQALLAGELDTFTANYPCHAPGRTRWFKLTAFRYITNGRAIVVVSHEHAGELWNAERAELASVISSIADAVSTSDRHGRLTMWNTGAEHLYGYIASEVIGRTLDVIVPEDRWQELIDVRARVLAGEPSVHLETTRRHKDGTLIDVAITISLIRDASGHVIGSSAIAHDIREQKRREKGQQLLATVSDVLARSLDIRATLEQVANLVVPAFADWCTINLFDEQRVPRRVTVKHADPAKADIADRLTNYALNGATEFPQSHAMFTGQPTFFEAVPSHYMTETMPPEFVALHHDLGMSSLIIVPLEARGTVLGALGFVCGDSGRRYSTEDFALATEIARRAATAIDNAQLYRASRAAEDEYRTLVEQIPAVMYRTSIDGTRELYLSPQVEQIIGYTTEEWQGPENLRMNALHPDDVERVAAEMARTDASLDTYAMEHRYLTKSGDTIWVRNTAQVVCDDAGEPLFWQGFVTDITAAKQAESRLVESEQRFRTIFDFSPIGIITLDAQARILAVNPVVTAAVGYTEHELIGQPVSILLDDADDAEGKAQFARLVSGELDNYTDIRPYIHRDGSRIWGRISIGAVRDDSGAFLHSVSMVEDITNQRQTEVALRETSTFLQTMFDASPLAIISIDASGHVISWNPAAEAMFGWSAHEVLGQRNPIIPVDQWDDFLATHQQELHRGTVVHRSPLRITKDGRLIHTSIAAAPMLSPDGVVYGTVGMIADVTERTRSDEQIRFQANLLDTVEQAVIVTNLAGEIVFWNRFAMKLYGWSSGEALGVTVADLLHPELEGDDAREVAQRIADGEGWAGEFTARRKDGSRFWAQILNAPILDEQGSVSGFIGVSVDISERRQLEQQLAHQALHDSLTGLPNRTLLMDRLQHACAAIRRQHGSVAVLFLDLDNFKLINDSLGHAVGDEALIEIAHRLSGCVRAEDTIARFGGDEFVIVLQQIQRAAEAVEVAGRILATFDVPLQIQDRELVMSPSIGIALSEGGRLDRDELMRNADIAMYRAKSAGKGSYHLFDADMQGEALQRLELEHDLRRAIERAELSLAFQPIISLTTGLVSTVEALLRWEHPERGPVAPSVFIPIAEESSMIVTIGDWVLQQACAAAVSWQRTGDAGDGIRVSVNLSARQFREDDLIARVQHALASTGLPPHLLVLELTESAVMQDAGEAVMRLRELRALGVLLAIDDFGTGYSSLSYLHDFPVQVLKIDRSFVSRIGHERDSTPLVAGTIRLAQALGIHAVAEGIETEAQYLALQQEGCDLGQGFYFSRPLPESGIRCYLQKRATDGS